MSIQDGGKEKRMKQGRMKKEVSKNEKREMEKKGVWKKEGRKDSLLILEEPSYNFKR